MVAKTDQKYEKPNEDPEPLILGEVELFSPPDRRFWTDPSMDERPHFTVSEVAKIFFAKTPDWMRWRSDPVPPKGKTREDMKYPDGWFLLDGKRVEAKRTPAGARYYTLHDIERMTHALAQNGGIGGRELSRAIRLVKILAEMYGHL